MGYDRSRRPTCCELDHKGLIVRKLRRYSQWFWSSYVVCLRLAGLPEGVLVETLVTVTDMFVVSSSLFKGYLLRHYFWST